MTLKTRLLQTSLLALTLACAGIAPASAQSTLRIGLAEDPDLLDPTMARTYVGRIVFASICDKLFDIDEKLNFVPQLALSHQTSADGKTVTIKLRPNVKFHDGEPFDAEAAKFSLERHLTLPGSFRRAEIAPIDKVEVVDPLTVRILLKAPFSPLLAQGGAHAWRQVRHRAGLRRPLQVRRAGRPGPHRGRALPRLLGQIPRQYRPHHLSADPGLDRASGQPEIGPARSA
jgi:ABC-type transport system substrate-binding protein